MVQTSTNLLDWTPVMTNTISSGSASVIDPGMTNSGRFYRARELQAP